MEKIKRQRGGGREKKKGGKETGVGGKWSETSLARGASKRHPSGRAPTCRHTPRGPGAGEAHGCPLSHPTFFAGRAAAAPTPAAPLGGAQWLRAFLRGAAAPPAHPPPHVVQVAHTWRRPPIGPAEQGRGSAGAGVGGVGVRDCGRGARRGAETVGAQWRPSEHRRQPDPAGLRLPPSGSAARKGASPHRRGGGGERARAGPPAPAGACRGRGRQVGSLVHLDGRGGETATPAAAALAVLRPRSAAVEGGRSAAVRCQVAPRRCARPGPAPAEGAERARDGGAFYCVELKAGMAGLAVC